MDLLIKKNESLRRTARHTVVVDEGIICFPYDFFAGVHKSVSLISCSSPLLRKGAASVSLVNSERCSVSILFIENA